MKAGAIPSVFEILLIEINESVEEEEDDNNNTKFVPDNNDLSSDLDDKKCVNALETENARLHKELEVLKCTLKSGEILNHSRNERSKLLQKQQSDELHSLNKQVEQLKSSIDQLKREKTVSRSNLTVSVLNIIDSSELPLLIRTTIKLREVFQLILIFLFI